MKRVLERFLSSTITYRKDFGRMAVIVIDGTPFAFESHIADILEDKINEKRNSERGVEKNVGSRK